MTPLPLKGYQTHIYIHIQIYIFSYTNTQGTYTYIQIYCDAPPAEQLWKMKVRLGSQSRPKLYMMMTGIPGGGLHPSIYIYIPGTQMTPVLIGKGLVLGRLTFKTSKVDVIGALYFSPSLSLSIYIEVDVGQLPFGVGSKIDSPRVVINSVDQILHPKILQSYLLFSVLVVDELELQTHEFPKI